MGETKTPDTKIIFGSREDIEKRTLKIKEIYGPSKNAFLIGDEYEKCRNVIQLMTLEGMSTDFIYDLMAEEPGDEYAMTADFLHSAAMIMGEEYVREHLLGRTIQAEEACRQIREDYYEKQMEPLRKMYEDLDAKIQAALSGEEQARQQLAILKLQNDHADELYKERLENAKSDFNYRLQLAQAKAEQKETTLKRDIAELQSGCDREEKRCRELQAENLELVEKLEQLIMQISAVRTENSEMKAAASGLKKNSSEEAGHDGKKDPEPLARKKEWEVDASARVKETDTTAQRKEPDNPDGARNNAGEGKRFPFFWRKKEENGQASGKADEEELKKKQEERRNYCISVLGSSDYTEEQVELILACMMNEKISRSVLEYICNPKLPIHNMKAMIRFLGGGNDDKES